MQIGIVSLFPAMFEALRYGITGRAIDKALLTIMHWNPRDFAKNRHGHIDDTPYGGGPGMVMQVQPLRDAIIAAKNVLGSETPVIYLSPQGRQLTQSAIRTLAARPQMILVSGRYEGVDERLIDSMIDEEWSIGDYVLSGGELPAMVTIDAITRLLDGALGDADSALFDSFTMNLLDYPHYTRPEEIDGLKAPSVLMSGNHEAINRWRQKQALGRTWLRRPDLLEQSELTDIQKVLLKEFICEEKNNE